MKLPDLHRRLLADALACGSTYRLVLAGGYAIQAHELVSRVSQDLELATNATAGMDEIVRTLAAGLEDGGWGISVTEIAPRMARLIATDPMTGERCELDVPKEVFHKPPADTETGPVLSRDDAVGLKVRALRDRGFPRDVIDVYSARDLYTTGELERLGAQHDEAFDLEELHGRLEVCARGSSSGWTTSGCGLPSPTTTPTETTHVGSATEWPGTCWRRAGRPAAPWPRVLLRRVAGEDEVTDAFLESVP
jgi:hypothetical protein